MSKQPEALRLADVAGWATGTPSWALEAASELRRLHSVNADLLEALQIFAEFSSSEEFIKIVVRTMHVKRARAAIAKATGSNA
jgi:hypothetical protein